MSYVSGSLFYYRPTISASILFTILFALSGLMHLVQIFKYNTPRVMYPVVLGAIEFIIGFITRAIAHDHYTSLPLYLTSQICLLIAPPTYALSLYFILGRTLYYIPYLAPLHPGRVLTTFIGLDFICGVLMGSGAGRVGNTNISVEGRKAGLVLIKAGLVLQCGLMLGFVFLAALFHRRCVRSGVGHKVLWIMVSLYASATCIFARSVFRVVEFFDGVLGPANTHEAYFYCFDVLVMHVVSVLFHFLHPGRFLPKSHKIYLSLDGATEKEGPGWVDKRHFLATVFDPFDLVGICTGRDAKAKFWENDQAEVNEMRH